MSDLRTNGAVELGKRAKSLQDLGEEIGALEHSLASGPYDEDLARRLIERKRERNSFVLINQLPTELLIDIFLAAIRADRYYFGDLTRMAGVAWLWKNIIHHEPRLWAIVDHNTTTKLLPIAIQRAEDFPLTVKMPGAYCGWDDNSDEESSTPRNAPFLEMVLPKLARWKEAYLFLQYDRPDLLERLERPAPLLKSCEVEAQQPWRGPSVDLFQGHTPSLTEVVIHGLPIRWDSSLFQNLRSISLHDIRENGPTIEEVLQSILSSPYLQYFQLENSVLSPGTVRHDIPPVETPQLKSLWILDMHLSAIQQVLRHLRAPALRRFFISPMPPDDITDHHLLTLFSDSLLHFDSNIYSFINHSPRLWISLNSHTGDICVSLPPVSTDTEPTIISVHFFHHPAMQGLQRCLGPLLHNVSSCPPITLVVSQSGNVPESDHWWMVDSEINDKVTEIDIRASGEKVFLRFLCTGRLIDGVVKWPFPKLEQLRLGELVSGAGVIQFLKRRYTPDIEELARILVPAPQSPLILEMPDQLAILDVDDGIFDPGDYEAYLDIMGARDV